MSRGGRKKKERRGIRQKHIPHPGPLANIARWDYRAFQCRRRPSYFVATLVTTGKTIPSQSHHNDPSLKLRGRTVNTQSYIRTSRVLRRKRKVLKGEKKRAGPYPSNAAVQGRPNGIHRSPAQMFRAHVWRTGKTISSLTTWTLLLENRVASNACSYIRNWGVPGRSKKKFRRELLYAPA